ncbi:MAG: hypothetical protein DMG57_02865 [Acidobacteria bacterium]|nr:MAG: hypothetical protein DMG57_02865 [Acidobacteriota bacterium]
MSTRLQEVFQLARSAEVSRLGSPYELEAGLESPRSNFRALRRDGSWFRSRSVPNDPEAETSAREFESRLQEHIAGLPEKLRSALLLSAVQGLDARTVGIILNVPEATARSRLFLARRQLLKTLLP